jgi:hypothetical protein
MKYVFHPEAEVEFVAAIDYYEDCEPGLGYDFAIEVPPSRTSSVFQKLGPYSKTISGADRLIVSPMALSMQSTKMFSSSFLSCTCIGTQYWKDRLK